MGKTNKQKKHQDPYICCLQQTHFRSKDTHRLKVRGWKKDTPCKWNISHKIDFKTKTVMRDKSIT